MSPRPDADQLLASLGAQDAVRAHNAAPWEDPAPLRGQAELPDFPVEAFPEWVGDMVGGVAEFTQTPPDLAGSVALAALSTAAGGRAVVEVRGAWREPVNLFTVVAMPAGSRKSAVFAAMTAPLLQAEKALADQTRPRIIEAQQLKRVADRDADRAAGIAAGADSDHRDAALARASAAALAAAAISVPVLPRLVADDVTPEAAATLLAEQGGRLAILSAEGGVFSVMAGRYTGVPSLEVFLKGHAGDLLRVDRKGRPAEHIDHPALTLGLAVQPDVLRDIASAPGFRGRGLLARILYALPRNTVGRRRIGTDPVPEHITEAYAQNLQGLVRSLNEWTDPAVLMLDSDAGRAVLDLERDLEPHLAPGARYAHLTDWASKWVGAVTRIAGLIHLAGHPHEGWVAPITADSMTAAARIGRYYLAHAVAAFDHMGADERLDDAHVLLQLIARTGKARVTRRELFSGVYRGRFARVSDLDPALELLEQHGWLRRIPTPERAGPGRKPSPAYDVHPNLSALPAQSPPPPSYGNSADNADNAEPPQEGGTDR